MAEFDGEIGPAESVDIWLVSAKTPLRFADRMRSAFRLTTHRPQSDRAGDIRCAQRNEVEPEMRVRPAALSDVAVGQRQPTGSGDRLRGLRSRALAGFVG